MTRIFWWGFWGYQEMEEVVMQAFDSAGIPASFRAVFADALSVCVDARNGEKSRANWQRQEDLARESFKYEQCVFRENYWAGRNVVHQRRTDAKERTLCGRWIEPQSNYSFLGNSSDKAGVTPKVVDLGKYHYRRCGVCRRVNGFDVAVNEMLLVETLPKHKRPSVVSQTRK